MEYVFRGKVWLYPSEVASWHFVTIPKAVSSKIKEKYSGLSKGWGSLPVTACIGKTTWTTSIFPDSKSGTYILPLKASVRKREGIFVDDTVKATLVFRKV